MPHSGRFAPVKYTVPIVQDAGWDSKPLWTGARNVTRTGIRTPGSPTSSCVTQSRAECLEIVWPFGTCSSSDGKSYSEGHITLHSARPDRPWANPASCKMGSVSFPRGRACREFGVEPKPIYCRGPRKSRAIPLLTLRAFMTYK